MNDRSQTVRGTGGPISPTAAPSSGQFAARMRNSSAAAIVAMEK